MRRYASILDEQPLMHLLVLLLSNLQPKRHAFGHNNITVIYVYSLQHNNQFKTAMSLWDRPCLNDVSLIGSVKTFTSRTP